ncbi:C40 family peptidase [Clostridium felsineum]|uniref:C40 family peptidase n=1 Tax=Clostridium felsineum TaxID=36839 RepID=UPI00214D6DCB|nr:NlpC/P60 family protein [Clostridium felsineum]MCR3761011.1 C40 family peptidase [Clostridium felsineum]
MHRKFLTSLVALSIMVSCSGNIVFASPLQDQYNKSLQQYQNALKSVQDMESQITALDNQIGELNESIKNTDEKINESKANIEITQKKIDKAKENITNEQQLYGDRLRAMYVNGTTTQYIEVILNSKNFSDFVSRLDAVKDIIKYDKGVINNFKSQQQEVEGQQKILVDQNNKLIVLQNDNHKKMDDLNNKKNTQNTLIAAAKAEEAKHSNEMQQIQKAIDDEKKKIQALNVSTDLQLKPIAKNVQNSSNNKALQSGDGLAIVKYAESFEGTPYLWGGTQPGGFDCSGLVQYVYGHFGIKLPRTTYEQVNEGQTVVGDLQPGDLIFFEPSDKGPDHVGIYAGDGYFIEAPHTGANVRLSPIRPYCAARRIIN